MLGNRFIQVSFRRWWNEEAIFVHGGQSHTRRKLVLSMANKDGGAHVDAELEEYYEALRGGEFAFGINGNLTFDGPAPYEQGVFHYATNAHLALIRQFAHETLVSEDHLAWPSIPQSVSAVGRRWPWQAPPSTAPPTALP
jgi:hypothetical protein